MIGFRAVGDDYGLGGIERVVAEVGARMVERGHDVSLFCRTRYANPELAEHRGMKILRVDALYRKSLESPSNAFLSTLRALRGYDIVHYHATLPALFSGLPRLCGTKTVVTVHGLDWKRAKWTGLMKGVQKVGAWAAGKFPNGTIVCSRYLSRYYKETYGVDARYISNAVEASERQPLATCNRFGVEPGEYVLSLGRLVPEKGVHTLIEAWRRTKTDRKLLVAGGAPYMDSYARRLRKLAGDDPRIVFAEPVYGDEKDALYSNAAFFCLPSEIEGMALVILEAMNLGCCPLVSDIPENVEVVDPDYPEREIAFADEPSRRPYGWTFRDRDPADLARQIDRLLDASELVGEIGAAALPYVRKQFNWDRSTDAHLAYYDELLGR